MSLRLETRGAFECVGSDGNRYVVSRVVKVLTELHRGLPSHRDGETELHCNGHKVGHVSKGRYRTWTGVDLKARDPRAP